MSTVVALRPWWFRDTGRQASFIQSSNLSCGLPSTFLFQCSVSLRQSEIVTTWSANLSWLYFPTKQTNVEAVCNISLVPYSRLQEYISLYGIYFKTLYLHVSLVHNVLYQCTSLQSRFAICCDSVFLLHIISLQFHFTRHYLCHCLL